MKKRLLDVTASQGWQTPFPEYGHLSRNFPAYFFPPAVNVKLPAT